MAVHKNLHPSHINKVVKITLEKDGNAVFLVGVLKQYQSTNNSLTVMFEGETDKQSFTVTDALDTLDGFTVEVF